MTPSLGRPATSVWATVITGEDPPLAVCSTLLTSGRPLVLTGWYSSPKTQHALLLSSVFPLWVALHAVLHHISLYTTLFYCEEKEMQPLQWMTALFRARILLGFGFLQGNEVPYEEHLTKGSEKLAEVARNLRDLYKDNWEVVQYFFIWQQNPWIFLLNITLQWNRWRRKGITAFQTVRKAD